MSQVRSLTCPSCGASLSTDGSSPEIKCAYCGNTVIVPPELRAKAPDQPPVVVFQMPMANGYQQVENAQRAGRGFMGCILAIVAVSVIGSLIIGVIAVVVPMAAVSSVMSSVSNMTTSIPSFANLASTSTPFSTRVREMTSTPKPTPGFGNLVMTIGSQGTGPGYFDDARGVAVDGDGNIYVSEYTSGRVQKFDAQGKFVTTWNAVGKNPLRGLAADRMGNIFVVRQGAILKYNADGDLKGKFQGSDYFDDVTVLPDGSLEAFAYQNSDDLIKLNKQGNVVSRIKQAISSQTDSSELEIRVAVDGLGNTFALGTFNNGVFKFNRDGKYVSKFGEEGSQPGQFRAPQAIAVDNQGRVYVADIQGIQVFSSEGRYLSVIKVPNLVAFGLAFDSKNALYAASRDHVYKFAINGDR